VCGFIDWRLHQAGRGQSSLQLDQASLQYQCKFYSQSRHIFMFNLLSYDGYIVSTNAPLLQRLINQSDLPSKVRFKQAFQILNHAESRTNYCKTVCQKVSLYYGLA